MPGVARVREYGRRSCETARLCAACVDSPPGATFAWESTLIRAFYMTAITLTTVGYGDEIAGNREFFERTGIQI